jgi:hypothetical protein
MNKRTFFFIVVALLGSLLVAPSVFATSVIVDAKKGIANPLDTGINVTAGQILTITCNPADDWSIYTPDPAYSCNANGMLVEGKQYTDPVSSYTANYGAMVGKIDNGPYFLVGTSYGPTTVGLSGLLYLICWDGRYDDNSGFITADVNVVPIPASALLLGSGLMSLGLLGWRRKRS